MKLALLAATTVLASSVAWHAAAEVAAIEPRPAKPSVVLSDSADDVWTYSDTTVGYTPDDQPEADVLQARVVHKPNTVRVRLVFDDIRRVSTQWYWCLVRIPDGRTMWFVLEAAEGHWRGKAYQEIEGEWVKVPGLSHHIDYASDVVTLALARSLLDQPAWVRVKLWNELGLGDGTFYTDNPETTTHEPAFTIRLAPG
jgi:hypothetical protein